MLIRISADIKDFSSRVASGKLRAALAAGAVAVRRAIEDFYRAKPSSSGFYARQVAGGRVAVTSLSDTRSVITHDSYEIAHRIRGGTVRPIPPRRALAIPLTPEARAAGYPSNNRIPGLFRPKGTRVLAVKEGDGIRALWALSASVTHRPDPSSAVPPQTLSSAASSAMRDAILLALRKS